MRRLADPGNIGFRRRGLNQRCICSCPEAFIACDNHVSRRGAFTSSGDECVSLLAASADGQRFVALRRR